MDVKPDKIKMIVGLGNPGKEYESTYHNVGFLFINHLTDKRSSKIKSFEYARADDIIFIKPLTYMNESGKAVFEAMKYFAIKSDEILLVHDDVDITPGEYKFSFGGGSAGHKGVESIIKYLGTKNFWRLRIGIAKYKLREEKKVRVKAEKFVLKNITKEDLKKINLAFDRASGELLGQ